MNDLIRRAIAIAVGTAMLALLSVGRIAVAQDSKGTEPSNTIAGKNFAYRIVEPSPTYGPTSVYDDGMTTYFQLRKEATPQVTKGGTPGMTIPASRDGLLLTVAGLSDDFQLRWPDATTAVKRERALAAAAVVEGSALPTSVSPTVLAESGFAASKPLQTVTTEPAPNVAPPTATALSTSDTSALRIDGRLNWVRFEARADELLSKALRAAIANSVWQDIVWDLPDDFVIRHPFSVVAADLPELFGKVLAPFNLDARFHRGNHLVHVFPTQGGQQ